MGLGNWEGDTYAAMELRPADAGLWTFFGGRGFSTILIHLFYTINIFSFTQI